MGWRNPVFRNEAGTLIDVEKFHPDFGWLPFTANPDDVEQVGRDLYAEIIASAAPIAPYVPPSSVPTVDNYRKAIQACLDAKAKERNYDDGHTIATYVNSSVESWAAEAQAFVAWRDQVWVYAFSELEKVQNGQRPAPTPAEFCEELPPFEWPA